MVAPVIALLENKEQSQQVKSSLEQAGHDVIVVDTYKKAKALLLAQPCSLFISDVHLENGGSVFDFLKWIKSNQLLSSIPFVLLSLEPTQIATYLRDGVRMAARQLGAAKYVTMEKFDASVLIEALSEFLPQRQDTKSALITNNTGE